MTQGNSMKLIFQFFLPILIGNLFQQLYSFVDSMVVGKGIGDVALAAVGNTSSVHFLILGFAIELTGGLGIDTFYFAQKAGNVIYVERFPEYCTAAQHNFKVLNTSNIHIIHSDACDIIQTLQADTFYLDPARRGNGNKRLFALTDCEPDILQLKPLLLERARRVIVKISPMADPEETLRLLPETRQGSSAP